MNIHRSFSILHFLPIIVILCLIPHLLDTPIVFLALNLLTIILFYIFDLKLIKLPYTLIKFILTLLVIILIPINFGFHFTQNIAIVLLTSMSCLKLLEIQNYQDKRNIFIVLFLGYFLVATYFLNSQSLAISLYAILIIFVLTLNLGIFSRVPLTTIPLLALIRLIAKLAITAIPLTIILFLFFPRIPGPLWTLPSDDSRGTTGISGEMYPGSVNSISESNEIAFRIDFQSTVPAADKLYWRGPVLSKTDGLSWQQHPLHEKPLKTKFEQTILNPKDYVEYKVTLEPQKQKWVYTLEMGQRISSNFLKRPYLSRDMQFLVKHKISQVVQYQARSATTFYYDQVDPLDISLALQYPGGSNPKTFALGTQWKNQYSKQEIIDKALDLFRFQDFYYTRTPPLMLSNPADQFLFDAKQGFCEHFASSFVLLMRAAGIPARVVAGYQGIEYNQLGDYYVVRQSNAHAWAEVWLDNQGWRRIDPTAVVPQDHINDNIFDYRNRDLEFLNINYSNINRLTEKLLLDNWQLINDWSNSASLYMDTLKYNWNNWLLGYDTKKQRFLMELMGFHYRWRTMVLLMVGLIFGVFSFIFYFQLIKKIRNQDPVLKSYNKLLHKLQRLGLTIHHHDGPEKIKKLAIKQFQSKEQKINAIFNYYIQLRYSQNQKSFSKMEFKRMVAKFNVTDP